MPHITPIQIQRYLGGLEYPVTKQGLIEYAEEQGAPHEIVEALHDAPERDYETPADLIHGMGETS